MGLKISHDATEDCAYVTITGDISLGDYRTILETVWHDVTYAHAAHGFWDFTQCQTKFDFRDTRALARQAKRDNRNPSPAQIASAAARQLAAFTQANRPSQLPPRVALLVSNELDYGMMRVFAGFAVLETDEMRIFKDRDSAQHWLFEP